MSRHDERKGIYRCTATFTKALYALELLPGDEEFFLWIMIVDDWVDYDGG